MEDRVLDEVTGWESRAVVDGYAGLRSLADEEFTGAVEAGRTWAFLLNGRIVGVVDGRIESFDGAPLSVYEAPDPSLPLLYAMQAGESRTRASYFTDDTPLSEADATLSEGGFTGYVELSENVLSGDYYVVYYGGRSLPVAFVGNSRRMLTGDEAFERADDEVGIYEVREADVEVVDVPAASTAADADASANAGPETEPEPDDDQGSGSGSDPAAASTGGDGPADAGSPPGFDEGDEPSPFDDGHGLDLGVGGTSDRDDADATGAGSDVDGGAEADAGTGTGDRSDSPGESSGATAAESGGDPGPDSEPDTSAGAARGSDPGSPGVGTGGSAGDRDDIDLERSLSGESASEPSTAEPSTGSQSGTDRAAESDPEPGSEPGTEPEPRSTDLAVGSSDEGGRNAGTGADADAETDGDADAGTEASDGTASVADATGDATGGVGEPSDAGEGGEATAADPADDAAVGAVGGGGAAGSESDAFAAEERWREDQVVPALDPAESGAADVDDAADTENGTGAVDRGAARGAARPGSAGGDADADADADTDTDTGAGVAVDREPEAAAEVGRLRARLDEAESARAEAEAELDRLASERAELVEERDAYRERAERLAGRVNELESEVERLTEELSEARERADARVSPDATEVSPAEALRGANVFVRYGRASGATLAKAVAGEVDRDQLHENLRLEHHHTRFDDEDAVVEGEPFGEFLRDTTQYGFVAWIVRDLLFDIGETGNAEALDRLVEAVPESDRAELDGGVTVPADEGAESGHEALSFDVVVRDRMGNPLVVADLNTSRDAATQSQMESLIEKARKVGAAKEQFAGAFLVTASFFDPAALETADAATAGGGLLGGSSRRSYVKLSRRAGFHLCLVETRGGAFHMNVPEL